MSIAFDKEREYRRNTVRGIKQIKHSLDLAARGIRSPSVSFLHMYLISKPSLDSEYPIPERRNHTR